MSPGRSAAAVRIPAGSQSDQILYRIWSFLFIAIPFNVWILDGSESSHKLGVNRVQSSVIIGGSPSPGFLIPDNYISVSAKAKLRSKNKTGFPVT